MIPVGGEAKRLKPMTAEVSKAVVRIFCKPMVEFAVADLAQQGVKNFVMGVKGYVNYVSLMDYFKDGLGLSTDYGIYPQVHIKYQPNFEDVGSADSVRINMEYFDIDGPVIVVQGDNLFDLDLCEDLSDSASTAEEILMRLRLRAENPILLVRAVRAAEQRVKEAR